MKQLKKRFFFRASHALATLAPHFFGITKPYHEIKTPFALPGKGRLFLGAILLDAPQGVYHRYDYKTIVQREHLNLIVRTLEPFELETKLWGGVNAATRQQYQALNVNVIDLTIRDFIANFNQTENDFVLALFEAIDKIDQAQTDGKNIYFHCKAGKNRSFKAITTYLVYVQLKDTLKTKQCSEQQLKNVIHKTCLLIKSIRPQIIYGSTKKRIEHEAFVFACFKRMFF